MFLYPLFILKFLLVKYFFFFSISSLFKRNKHVGFVKEQYMKFNNKKLDIQIIMFRINNIVKICISLNFGRQSNRIFWNGCIF